MEQNSLSFEKNASLDVKREVLSIETPIAMEKEVPQSTEEEIRRDKEMKKMKQSKKKWKDQT